MMKKLLYSSFILKTNKYILGLFYDKKFLSGYYFEEKRMGWIWAWNCLPSKLMGVHRKTPFPVNKNTLIANPKNIEFDNSSINAFQTPGCYFQAHSGKIKLGKNVQIAPNVGLITTNHDIYNVNKHVPGKDIIIGDNCWIGMNCVVLPGVILGAHTIVGAGAVVTKSFEEGNCIIGGVPARIVKYLDKSKMN